LCSRTFIQAQAARDIENTKLRQELGESHQQLKEKDGMLKLYEEQLKVLKEEIRKDLRDKKRGDVNVEYEYTMAFYTATKLTIPQASEECVCQVFRDRRT